VTIALVTITIPGSDLLTAYNAGAQTAVKQINSTGGFGGRMVRVITCNSMDTGAATTACARETIGQHPVAMIGCEPNWGAAGLPVYAAAQTPSFNCLNTKIDGNAPYSYALGPGGYGLFGAEAKFACTLPNVKHVVMLAVDIPVYRAQAQTAAGAPLQACGKTFNVVYYPVTVTDPTSYVTQVASQHPDFVLFDGLNGPSAVLIYKGLAQDGIPPSKVIVPESNLTGQALQQAGSAMEGTYGALEFASWSDTSDPTVAAYVKATTAQGVDPRDSNVEVGYTETMFIYEAAKKIGFDSFNTSSLVSFIDSSQNSGFPIPLSRTLTIPGPAGYKHALQPYGQIVQLHNLKLNVVTTGTDNGWINGF
jgi:ABC-type branched-subunit amino acid transport system substrate-binding protein